jgi:hypothetical protein
MFKLRLWITRLGADYFEASLRAGAFLHQPPTPVSHPTAMYRRQYRYSKVRRICNEHAGIDATRNSVP